MKERRTEDRTPPQKKQWDGKLRKNKKGTNIRLKITGEQKSPPNKY